MITGFYPLRSILSITFLFLFFTTLSFSQETFTYDTAYFDKKYEETTYEKRKATRIMQVEAITTELGEKVYPFTYYDKKGRPRIVGYSRSSDSLDLYYLYKQFDKKNRLKRIALFSYVNYLEYFPELQEYYGIIEPYLQDTFIDYTSSFNLHLNFNRKGRATDIAVSDPDCGCLMTELSTLFSKEFIHLEDTKDGETHGRDYWFFKNGNIRSRTYEYNGKKEGIWEHYYKNGNLISRTTYKEGEKHGNVEWYHKNGKLKTQGQYRNGLKDGRWYFYSENGKMIDYSEYDADRGS